VRFTVRSIVGSPMLSWVRGGALLVVVLVAGLVAPAPAHAEPTKIGTLTRRHAVLTFKGGVDNPTPFPLVNPPVPVVCEVTCQSFTFKNTTNRPFLVSVKDTAGSTNNGWDLYVYDPSGATVGSANGIGANGQAVVIEKPIRGTYTIAVTFTYAYDATAAYKGEVRLMSGVSWKPPKTTLPVFDAIPAYDLRVDGLPPVASTPLGFPFPFAIPTPSSCYVDETANPGASRCLRFTTNVRNVGGRRLDLELTFDGVNCKAYQIAGDPAVRHPAGPCEFHLQHMHFHYKDLVGFALYKVNADGSIGRRVGAGTKESFCLADDDYFGFGTAGPNGPRTYAGQPDCSVPTGVGEAGAVLEEGLTPGWGDVYTWDTPGQFIDISSVPAGHYALVERTNPGKTLLVDGPVQVCSATELSLTDDAVKATATRLSVPCPAD
jgi:hypothetical protein